MCVNPIQVKVTSRTFGFSRYIDAPCGHCVECLKRRQNDWKLRIVHESNYWSRLYFFTLTYNNDSLPCRVDYLDLAYPERYAEFYGSYNQCKGFADDDMIIRSSACKDDVQRFLKRMRTNYERKHGKPLEMKYFVCAEYGPNPNGTKRPHYHGVIMTDAEYYDLLPEFNQWKADYGRMEFKQVGFGRDQSSKVANYISKYCAKGCFESRIDDIRAGFIERAWYIMSKNIGLRWLEENMQHWLKYVPTCASIEGDWTLEDVEKFFASGTDKAVMCAKEIDTLIDNFFVMDGDSTYSYKMPRYYRERLLCVRKTFTNSEIRKKNGNPLPDLRLSPLAVLGQSQLQSAYNAEYGYEGRASFAIPCVPQPITFASAIRKDKRYVAENFLSVAFAYRTSVRVMHRYKEEFNALRILNPALSDSEIDIQMLRQRARARSYRESMSTTSLRDFYNSNMWKHREFDYESDGVLDYNILNL